jgi:hypothetical protein
MEDHEVAVLAEIRPGKRDQLLRVLAQGPPFDPAESGFDEHAVLVGDRDVVFLFRGPHAEASVHKLAASGVAMVHLAKLGSPVGSPRIVRGAFHWSGATIPA